MSQPAPGMCGIAGVDTAAWPFAAMLTSMIESARSDPLKEAVLRRRPRGRTGQQGTSYRQYPRRPTAHAPDVRVRVPRESAHARAMTRETDSVLRTRRRRRLRGASELSPERCAAWRRGEDGSGTAWERGARLAARYRGRSWEPLVRERYALPEPGA